MFGSIFDTNEKQLKKIWPIVGNVNSFEESVKNLSREEMVEKTKKWKEELKNIGDQEIEKRLGEILPEAYALVRESSSRTLKMRHYDVQILAGIILHQGKIAEQKTGEGKTLTATLPLYLNSLTGRGVHLVTPNDYLSRHGAGWMGPIYDYLGVSVGVIVQDRAFVYDPSYQNTEFEDSYSVHLREVSRQGAYKCDIVYGTNHEFGFDYLRDNMVRSLSQMVQTNPNGDWGVHSFAIVDEVDSILIDMARTPLIISAADAKPSERYHQANEIIKSLIKDTDYEIEEKYKNVTLTDLGIRRVERLLGVNNLYEQDFEMVHLIEQALLANTLYEKDRDYVVKNGAVIIVDQFTGRLLPNNRFSNGLHQAIEAKEGVTIQQESKTLAEISYQNYFRMYKKLAGMTGTAATESEEFFKIYKLEVLVVPTNKPCIRKDDNDVVYKTEAAKFKAVVDEIEERHKKGQPVLVGTTSVEKSELLHRFLQKRNITHEILNAKNHEREALIIAQAGREGAVTISTNMAGRGVDIILGGDPPDVEMQKRVIESGGLFVVGTERHESRRIDNQLRGRSGRQGDPGESKFFVSLQDDLMRIFGGESVSRIMDRFGLDENVPLEAGIVSRSIENAQKRVEGFNFDRRKRLVEMDDIMNTHREVIYKLRRRILELGEGIEDYKDWLIQKFSESSSLTREMWEQKEKEFGKEMWYQIVSGFGCPVIDYLWMEHLVDMDQIREGIGLRGYAQRDPMVEYKREGHERFEILVSKVYSMVGDRLASISKDSVPKQERGLDMGNLNYQKGEIETGVSGISGDMGERKVVDASGREVRVQKIESGKEKIGRNDPCPCGSGKKYKNCHGKNV
ncbi:MAG TPA: preprotein translocase subunit SecA [bacterium]|jgi:preprotein translocase subunit SecA|nr:preprotein translocase subunit SecA [bacterium]HQG58221.1 preprotein translocase subunit SecA [bacterium]HQG78758.1 preprotein translocase subunit SecA [bacterium]HQK41417.1 preprotein translocase subunit SecA [bacterium]